MVIQRWQSLYLLVATVLMGIYSYVPVIQIDSSDALYSLSALGLKVLGSPDGTNAIIDSQLSAPISLWAFFALAVLIVILSFVSIFQYKHLKLQMRMCAINSVLTIALVGSLAVIGLVVKNTLAAANFHILSANFLPICAIILYWMAYQAIKKDNKILTSYDRIR